MHVSERYGAVLRIWVPVKCNDFMTVFVFQAVIVGEGRDFVSQNKMRLDGETLNEPEMQLFRIPCPNTNRCAGECCHQHLVNFVSAWTQNTLGEAA